MVRLPEELVKILFKEFTMGVSLSTVTKLAAATSLSILAFASQAADIPLTNASFESSVAGPLTYAAPSSTWGTSGAPTVAGSGGYDGGKFALLDAGETIYQAFNSLDAGVYSVNFWASGQGLSSVFASEDVQANNYANPVGTTGAAATWGPGWQAVSYTFTATANNPYHVIFEGAGAGLGIDGVTVTAVPEPESYAMMLAGLGAMGFVARRRKSRSV